MRPDRRGMASALRHVQLILGTALEIISIQITHGDSTPHSPATVPWCGSGRRHLG